jgi:hypothetical protein
VSLIVNSLNLANYQFSQSPKTEASLAHLDLASKPREYVLLKAPINYLGKKFSPLMEVAVANIQALTQQQILNPQESNIYCLPREQAKHFHFKENGFEFRKITGDLHTAVKQLAQTPDNNDSRINVRKAVVPYLTQWGKAHGIDFDLVVPVDTVYRNTNQDAKNAFGSVPLAHVDFPETDYPKTLQSFEANWKPRVDQAMQRELSSEEYRALNVSQAINIWIPLNERNTENTLALMDLSTLNQPSDLQPYTAVRRDEYHFTSQGVLRNPNQKWVIQSDMKSGDAVIFNTLRTPHTAIDVPKYDCDPDRQSIELRVLFIKN